LFLVTRRLTPSPESRVPSPEPRAPSPERRTPTATSMQKINYRVTDAVAIIELNDPPANTYSYEIMLEIDGAVEFRGR
jgi:hypothetical protein